MDVSSFMPVCSTKLFLLLTSQSFVSLYSPALYQKGVSSLSKEASAEDLTDMEAMEELMEQHSAVSTILQARLTNIQVREWNRESEACRMQKAES